jgi:hypothetical protein
MIGFVGLFREAWVAQVPDGEYGPEDGPRPGRERPDEPPPGDHGPDPDEPASEKSMPVE